MTLTEEVVAQTPRRHEIPVLKTERLILRAPRLADVKAIVQLANDRLANQLAVEAANAGFDRLPQSPSPTRDPNRDRNNCPTTKDQHSRAQAPVSSGDANAARADFSDKSAQGPCRLAFLGAQADNRNGLLSGFDWIEFLRFVAHRHISRLVTGPSVSPP